MLQNVAMPDIASPAYIEWERLSIVITELDSSYRDFLAGHAYDIQKLLLLFHWGLCSSNFVGSHIYLRGNFADSSWNKLPVFGLPVFFILFDVEIESAYDLEIDEMDMDWMIIHGEIYYVKIIGFALLIDCAFASHLKRDSIYHDSI